MWSVAFLSSPVAKALYKSVGLIAGMELSKHILQAIVSEIELFGIEIGSILSKMIGWAFGIAQSVISLVESFVSVFSAIFGLSPIALGASLIDLIGNLAVFGVSTIVFVALGALLVRVLG